MGRGRGEETQMKRTEVLNVQPKSCRAPTRATLADHIASRGANMTVSPAPTLSRLLTNEQASALVLKLIDIARN